MAQFVLSFMCRHRGIIVRLDEAGAWEAVSWPARNFLDVAGQSRCTSEEHDCVRAATINAAFAIRGSRAGDVVSTTIDGDGAVI